MEANKYIEIFERLAKENNLLFEYKFKSNVGRYYKKENKVCVSKPINPERLQVGLHEIGHSLFIKIKPSYVQEYLCEKFSFEVMKKEGIPIKEKTKERSKNYIAIKTQMAINRGLQTIDKDVRNYIKQDYPSTAELKKGFVKFNKANMKEDKE